MDEMIDFLRNQTIFARHSRAETRDFLERLDIEGFEIAKKLMPPPDHAPEAEMPPVQPMPVAEEAPVVETSAS